MKFFFPKKLINWLDEHLLLLLSGILIAFIPLWPKIPLFSPIEQYIVRVRFEDILVLFTGIIWLIQVFRKKIIWKSIYFYIVLAYAIVGLLSVISGVFIIDTIPLEPLHLGKSLLHYFRYLEYFSLFFILYSAIKNQKDIKKLLLISGLTVIAISVYGYGQKYLYWPVYSTMNREFSKGVRLYLTEHARVQSTFAGHYDLGAYLVVLLPLLLSLFIASKKRLNKIFFFLSFLFGLWLLIVSASRMPFASFLIASVVVIALFAIRQKSFIKKITFGLKYASLIYLITGTMMVFFGADMFERFLQILEGYPSINKNYQYFSNQIKEQGQILSFAIFGDREISIYKAQKPANGIAFDNNDELGNVLTPTDQLPVTQKPSDVYVDVPDLVAVATQSASGATTIVYEERDRIFSDCAIQKGLSLCIRLETLWPQAIEGFKMNPLFGKGYATLNKESKYHFTEAESTDNNLLRTLGETGMLGFLSFYGVVAVALIQALINLKNQDALKVAMSIALIAASLGLLTNAVYIDVFAASKVAFTYWALVGMTTAYLNLDKKHEKTK